MRPNQSRLDWLKLTHVTRHALLVERACYLFCSVLPFDALVRAFWLLHLTWSFCHFFIGYRLLHIGHLRVFFSFHIWVNLCPMLPICWSITPYGKHSCVVVRLAAEKIMFLPFSPVPTTYLVLGTSFIGWLPKIILFAEKGRKKRQKWKHPIEEIVCFLEKLILRKLFRWASAPTPLFSPENVL